jgi:signal transduction histidine kinase
VRSSISNMIKKTQVTFISDFSEVNDIYSIKSYVYSIFLNLISNSIKYRRPEQKPVIMITSSKVKDQIEISFKDNGMGIDLEKNGRNLFGLYKRFHYDIEGKGMGLYMVKAQVESLGGTISANSELNKGTEFIIRFSR